MFRSQSLMRASTRVLKGVMSYRTSRYDPGDELCCPRAHHAVDARLGALGAALPRERARDVRAAARGPGARGSGRHHGLIRPCRDDERGAILAIVNAAAEVYRGVIPADRWHEPYMPAAELDAEIAAGVAFWGYEEGGALLGIMGIQPVDDVELIRHAYVAPDVQGRGVGGALLQELVVAEHPAAARGDVGGGGVGDPVLRAARVRARRGRSARAELLRRYWDIPSRQIETSVVLSSPSARAV